MPQEDLELRSCALSPGVVANTDGTVEVPGRAPDETVTCPVPQLPPGRRRIDFTLRHSSVRALPDIRLEVWGPEGLLAARRVSTRATSASMTFDLQLPAAVTVVLRSNFSAFTLVGVTSHEALSPLDRAGARRQRLIASLGLTAPETRQGMGPVDQAEVEHLLFSRSEITAVPVDALAYFADLVRTRGVDTAAVQSLFRRNNTEGSPRTETDRQLLGGHPRLTNEFQEEIVRSGALSIPDPYGGGLRTTSHGYGLGAIPGLATTVYEFTGERPVVAAASTGWPGTLAFVWLVDDDLILYDNVVGSDWVDPQQTICAYVTACLRDMDSVLRYRTSPTTVAIVAGIVSNMGHYFWNDVSGVERVHRAGLLPGVGTVYTTANNWLSVQDLFPDQVDGSIVRLDSPDELFQSALNAGHLLVRPTGTAIDDALAARIHVAAQVKAGGPGSATVGAIDTATATSFVLYVNLRQHNKSWIEQVPGIAAVVAHLQTRGHRRVTLYLDGFPDCGPLVAEVRAAVADLGADVVDGTSVPFHETVLWAYACHLFLAVVGSGLVPLTWLAGKSGIAHGDVEHLSQLEWWGQVRVDGSHRSVVLTPGVENTRNVSGEYYSNYSVDPAVVVDLLDTLLDTETGPT